MSCWAEAEERESFSKRGRGRCGREKMVGGGCGVGVGMKAVGGMRRGRWWVG